MQDVECFSQTFVLWFLVYLTLFIDVKDFNNRFIGAITGFLVFASLLSSLISSLPKSAALKMADIWLLFYMINIILVIIIHIVIEYQQRKGDANDGVATSLENLKYPGSFTVVRSGYRTNTIAKFVLPVVIILFLLTYFTVSTAEMFAKGWL